MDANSKWTTVRMPREFAEALKVIAQKNRRSVASQASIIIEDYLASYFLPEGASTEDKKGKKRSKASDSNASSFLRKRC